METLAFLTDLIRTDISQLADEATRLGLAREFAALLAEDPRLSQLSDFHTRVLSLLASEDAESEPSDWEAITGLWAPASEAAGRLAGQDLYDRILGGWLGRCAGCLLGKPLENIQLTRDDARPGHYRYVRSLLQSAGAYPLTGYVPDLTVQAEHFVLHRSWQQATAGNIKGMPIDDDIDYSIVNTLILEQFGREWTQAQAVHEWMLRFPIRRIYCAGRIGYCNVGVLGIAPERAALIGNPFRQSLGGMIRADVWGWTNPGRPAQAARLAYRDSAITQTRNGIYAGIFWACAIAAAFVSERPSDAVKVALRYIPPSSRLSAEISWALAQYQGGRQWEQCVEALYSRYQRMELNHSLPNTALAVLGLLYGESDFTRTIGLTVMAGFDTDCTGATAGSLMGVMLGARRLPASWTQPLQNRIASSLSGIGRVSVTSMARRTMRLAIAR